MDNQGKLRRNYALQLRIVLFFIALLILLIIKIYLIPGDLERLDQDFIDAEQFSLQSILEARDHGQAEVLLTGDSVSRQYFSQISKESDLLLNVNETGFATMVSYYIYCHEFLKNRTGSKEHPLDIVIMLAPVSFNGAFEVPKFWAYNYLPWAESGNLNLLDEPTYQYMYGLCSLMRFRSISFLNLFRNYFFRRSYLLYCQYHDMVYSVDPLTEIWLPKISSLCREHKASLHLLSSPIPDISFIQERFQDSCLRLQNSCDSQETKFSQLYKNSLLVLPDRYFREDKIHLRDEYLDRATVRHFLKQMPYDSAIERCLQLTASYTSQPASQPPLP